MSLRDRTFNLRDKKVLLIDRCEATRQVRAAVLRSRGVEVHEPRTLQGAISLATQCLRSRDARRTEILSGGTLEFYGRIRDASHGQLFAFLMGAPIYLSLNWPLEVTLEDSSQGQWDETVKPFAKAA